VEGIIKKGTGKGEKELGKKGKGEEKRSEKRKGEKEEL
jgi:hypothetical protein